MPEINADHITETFLELVKINALSLEERPVNDYIIEKLRSWDFDFIEDNAGEKTGGNAGNIIVRVPGKSNSAKPFFLCSHTDTVRPTKDLQPVIENGVISSAGDTILGADNRAGIAILLSLLEQVASSDFEHNNFEVIFTIAEEIGLIGASNVDWTQVQAESGYVFDSSRPPGDYIAHTSSAMKFSIDVIGAEAHAGVAPEKGVNAISMAAEVVTRFPVGRIDDETVANIGVIRGGEATNVVAGKVHLDGEIRSFNPQTMERLIKDLRRSLDDVSQKFGGSYEMHDKKEFAGFSISESEPIAQHLHKKMQVVGLTPAPQVYSGGSDANVFNAIGKPTLNLGIGQKNPHANNECIAVADLTKMTELAMALVSP